MRIRNSLGALCVSLALSATGAWADYAYDTLVVAVQRLPGSLEPTQETSNVSLKITYNIYDKLFDFGPGNGVEGALATAWDYLDDQTLQVTLREGVTFHDGTAMTADDVAFTFGVERMMAEDAPAHVATQSYLAGLDRVEAIDDQTVIFYLNQADPRFHLKLGLWTTEIISRDHYEAVGGLEAYAEAPVGTGAYQVVEHIPGELIVLEAFDDHWRGAPAAARIEFRAVPEVATRIAGLLAGDFDIATNLPPDQLVTIEAADGLIVTGGPILNHRILAFRQTGTNAELMANADFRRALTLAVDTDLMAETIWGGRTTVPPGHQWADFGDYFVERSGPGYDPDAARAALEASGYAGEEIVYAYSASYTNGIPIAETMVAMWEAIGINVDFSVVESNTIRDQLNPDLRDWSNSLPYPDPEAGMWRLWQPAMVERFGYGWENDRFIELGQILATSTDFDERAAAHAEMVEIWDFQDPAGIVLHQNALFYGQTDAIDWQPYRSQFMDFGPRNLN